MVFGNLYFFLKVLEFWNVGILEIRLLELLNASESCNLEQLALGPRAWGPNASFVLALSHET